jgi:transcription-repair coupling factor (superfamily II helicase)
LEDQREIDSFAAEMIDRFGPLPDEVEHLLKILAIKRLCRDANIAKIDAGPRGASLSFRNNNFDNPAGLIGFINDQHGMAKLRPDHTFVYRRSWEDPEDRLQGVLWLAKQIAALAKATEIHSVA